MSPQRNALPAPTRYAPARLAAGPPRIGLAGMLLIAVCGGCANINLGLGKTEPVGAQPMQHPILEGIPLPNGYEFAADRSSFFNSGQLRIGMYTFIGSTDVVATYRFYKDYMGAAGFVMRQQELDNGQYTLRFTSETEECTIKLRRERGKTVLVIRLDPITQGPADRETKAPPARKPQ